MNENEVRQLLKTRIDKSGNVNQWAKENRFSGPFVYDVIKGKRAVSSRVAAALGLKMEVVKQVVFTKMRG